VSKQKKESWCPSIITKFIEMQNSLCPGVSEACGAGDVRRDCRLPMKTKVFVDEQECATGLLFR